MEPFESDTKAQEQAPSESVPAIELLTDPERAAAAWPEVVIENKEFLEQVRRRHILIERLDAVLDGIPRPDIPLQEAVANQAITEEQVANLYQSLTDLLDDEDYRRVILYLPFEFLPAMGWVPQSQELRHAIQQFQSGYLTAWHSLLHTLDVRANFVDGDVLESEQRIGDLPRVVKAAHLIPKLVQAGYLTITDIGHLQETSTDETLRQSIADTFGVLTDMGFVHDVKLDQDVPTREPRTDDSKDVTEKRAAWLKGEEKRKAVDKASDEVADDVTAWNISPEIMMQLTNPKAGVETTQIFIDGVRKAVETAARNDPSRATELYARYRELLLPMWNIDSPAVHDALSKMYCRLHSLGVMDNATIETLGIIIPKIAGPFSENMKTMGNEVREVQAAIASMESDPKLARFVYPVALMFGSRLKGYGTPEADTDVAVFVRPGTPRSEQENLKLAFKKTFAHGNIGGNVIQFWLSENADRMAVQDFEPVDAAVGESSWTHILFGAMWYGDSDTVRELREKLLVPYFYDTTKTIHEMPARRLYLEELERDTLQYRLMHKGYERFYPPFGGVHAPHANRIDGSSMFWDSGYRQTATKLFVGRVFLPKLSL